MDRYLTSDEINERLVSKPRVQYVTLRLFVLAFLFLFVGLILLAGFVFHEIGINTPLDFFYSWLHHALSPETMKPGE